MSSYKITKGRGKGRSLRCLTPWLNNLHSNPGTRKVSRPNAASTVHGSIGNTKHPPSLMLSHLCRFSDFGRLYLTIYWATLCDFSLVRKPWMCSFQEAKVCSIWISRLKVIAQTRKTAQTGLRLDIGPLRSLIAQPNEIQFKHGWTY